MTASNERVYGILKRNDFNTIEEVHAELENLKSIRQDICDYDRRVIEFEEQKRIEKESLICVEIVKSNPDLLAIYNARMNA